MYKDDSTVGANLLAKIIREQALPQGCLTANKRLYDASCRSRYRPRC